MRGDSRDFPWRGFLWAFSASDGKKLLEMELEAEPSAEGLAAAYGKLFVALQNGKPICFEGNL